MLTYDEGNIHGAHGTKPLCCRWEPDAPKAVLLFVHGVGEHHGRCRTSDCGRLASERAWVPVEKQMETNI